MTCRCSCVDVVAKKQHCDATNETGVDIDPAARPYILEFVVLRFVIF